MKARMFYMMMKKRVLALGWNHYLIIYILFSYSFLKSKWPNSKTASAMHHEHKSSTLLHYYRI